LLKQSGEDLTRENVLRQATNIKNLQLPMMLPGIKIDIGASDYFPVKQLQLIRLDNKRWVHVGEITGGKDLL